MRRLVLVLVPAVAGLVLSACTAGTPHHAAQAAGSPAGPAGSPGNPVVFSCADESFPGGGDTVPQRAQPGDLAVGPLIIIGGQRVATADPSGYGTDGRFSKVPFVVTMGATVTVTIDPPARGHVTISNSYAPAGASVTAATYRSCAHAAGFYAQGFAFTGGQTRGCVPLEVRSPGQPRVRHVTLSLFAGSCRG